MAVMRAELDRWVISLLAGLVMVCAGPIASAEPVRHEFTRLLMGVDVRIIVYAESEDQARAGAAAAFDRIAAIEDVASDWRASSEVMRLCAALPGTEVAASDDLIAMLACARRVSMASGGGFDVTIGAVTHLWRDARQAGRVPTQAEIAAARQAVGFRSVRIDEDRRTVRLERAGVVIDLGGIAQGYAAREALRVLDDRALGCAVVDVSGDLALGDPPPGREGWRVALPDGGSNMHQATRHAAESGAAGSDEADRYQREAHGDEGETAWRTMTLSRCAVSTSGDTEQNVLVLDERGEAVRESHILDPRRGRGVVGMRSVTIIGPDAMLCDALATAVSVMGPRRGGALVARIPEYEAIIVADEPRHGT